MNNNNDNQNITPENLKQNLEQQECEHDVEQVDSTECETEEVPQFCELCMKASIRDFKVVLTRIDIPTAVIYVEARNVHEATVIANHLVEHLPEHAWHSEPEYRVAEVIGEPSRVDGYSTIPF